MRLVAVILVAGLLGCGGDPIDDPDLATGQQAQILCREMVRNNFCPKLSGCSGGTYLNPECVADVGMWLDCSLVRQVRFSDMDRCRAAITPALSCEGLSASSLPSPCMTIWGVR